MKSKQRKLHTVTPEKVIRFYKMMKDQPLKVFLLYDFGHDTARVKKHLWLLMRLGVVERVDVRCVTGNSYRKGYRFKR